MSGVVRAARSGARLFRKDLRLLRRTPALVAVLIGYPLLVAVLVAAALRAGEAKPTVALVNEDTSGKVVLVGDHRLSLTSYLKRLAKDVTLRPLDPDSAEAALRDGRVGAVITIPNGFMASLASGLSPPSLTLETSRRSPIEADQIERGLRATLFDINQELSTTYVDYVSTLFSRIANGGSLCLFGRCGEIIGLGQADHILSSLEDALRRRGLAGIAPDLPSLISFVRGTRQNLVLVQPASNAIKSPIQLEVIAAAPGREPISAYGLAGALLVSLGLVGVLLAAAVLSIEREDRVLPRLGRGLVHPAVIVVEKTVIAMVSCLVVGMILLAAVAALTDVAIGRWALWLAALVAAGLTFGTFGALAGALARETRTALLAGLMVALPLIFLALVPGSAPAAAISAVTPFGAAFSAFQTLLVEPSVGTSFGLDIGHMLLVAAVLGAVSALTLARRRLTER